MSARVDGSGTGASAPWFNAIRSNPPFENESLYWKPGASPSTSMLAPLKSAPPATLIKSNASPVFGAYLPKFISIGQEAKQRFEKREPRTPGREVAEPRQAAEEIGIGERLEDRRARDGVARHRMARVAADPRS
jgi:hypothetical protein